MSHMIVFHTVAVYFQGPLVNFLKDNIVITKKKDKRMYHLVKLESWYAMGLLTSLPVHWATTKHLVFKMCKLWFLKYQNIFMLIIM